jgi:taurine dioxygenase
MDFTVTRLCPALGAEITGLDVSDTPSDNLTGAIRQALNEAGGLLVLRDQHLTPEQHVAFSRGFGPLFGEAEQLQDTVKPYLHPDFPQIYRVSNKVVEGKPQGRQKAGTYWHSDVSFRKRPAMVSILHGIEVPPLGGDTVFTNMTLAWEALSDAMKEMIAPLRAVHHFAGASNAAWSHEAVPENDLDGSNVAEHPVVRVHAETGARSLFVNPGNTSHLVGFSPEESKALLGFLYQHALAPEFQYRHRWRPRDLVMWDNRCTLHYAIADYAADRYMHRTTVIGEEPLAAVD